MAGVSQRDIKKLGAFPKGIVNQGEESQLPADEFGRQIALREAVNVDISNAGVPSRRAGYTQVIAGVRMHSGWSHPVLPFALMVADGVLCGYTTGSPPVELVQDIGHRPVSYELVGDRVYWCNGHTNGIITIDMDALPWGVESPRGQPNLAAIADGALEPGKYQIAVTFRSPTGQDSGTPLAAEITLNAVGGIELSDIPQPLGPGVATVRVWMSPQNGDVLYLLRELALGMDTLNVGGLAKGKVLETQLLDDMPVGDHVRLLNDRLYVRVGNRLVASEPLRYGLTDLANNSFKVGARITLCEPIASGTDAAGMFVADEKRTYWFGGGSPDAFSRRICYTDGAVEGTAVRTTSDVFGYDSVAQAIYWIARDGAALLGSPGGTVQPIRPEEALAPSAERGATLFRRFKGMTQMITTLESAQPQRSGVRDRAVARVYRNGVQV